jgi:glycyl-tRNA synthetase beta chain
LDFEQRIKAVANFRQLPEAESLAAANKRIANILKKVKGDIPTQVNPSYFKEEQEATLHQELSEYAAQAEVLFADADYAVALTLLAGLRDTVDNFFDHVMVMDKDETLRNNRLALLNQLRTLFLKVADVSVLQFG